MNLFKLAIIVSLAGALCSCGSESAVVEATQGQGTVTWLSQGEGEPNADPLWKLRPGFRQFRVSNQATYRDRGLRQYDTLVGEMVEFHGKNLYPVGHAAMEGLNNYPSEPPEWKGMTQSENGDVWLHGQPRAGLYSERVLWIPGEVRVGMKWETKGPQGVITGEVVSREVTETVFGERPVWSISVLGSPSYTASFIEGYGPIKFSPFEHYRGLLEGAHLTAVPLEDAEPSSPAARIHLERIEGGVVEEAGLLRHVNALRKTGADEWTIIGISRALHRTALFSEVETEQFCLKYSRTAGVRVAEEDCAWGSPLTIHPDGRQLIMPTRQNGSVPPTNHDCGDLGCPSFLKGVYWGLDDKPYALMDGQPYQARFDGLWVVAPKLNDTSFPLLEGAVNWMPFDTVSPAPNVLTSPSYSPETMMGGDGTIRTMRPFPRLQFASYNLESGSNSAFQVYPRFGSYNIASFPGGRTVTQSNFDGRLEAFHVLEDTIGVEVLGDVVVPENEFVTAALRLSDNDLLVFTQRGYRGVDNWYELAQPGDGADPRYPPDYGEVVVYRARIPSGGSAIERASNAWSLTGTRSGRDALVCWSNPAESVEQGWTLGGEDVEARLTSEGRCVVLIREAGEFDFESPGEWAVEGPVPGAGRMALGGLHLAQDLFPFGEPTWSPPFSPLVYAPLAGGGIVSDSGHTIDAGLLRRYRDPIVYEYARAGWSADPLRNANNISQSAADRAGHGIWAIRHGNGPGSTDQALALISPGKVTMARTGELGIVLGLVNASEGGGVVYLRDVPGAATAIHEVIAVDPDGAARILPLPSYRDVKFKLADDTTCGVSGDTFRCTSPTTGEEQDIGVFRGRPERALVREGDGVYWPIDNDPSGVLLSYFKDSNLTELSFDLTALGGPAGAAVTWHQKANGAIIGAATWPSGGALLTVKNGVIEELECASTDDIPAILSAGPLMPLLDDGILIDQTALRRVVLPASCELMEAK